MCSEASIKLSSDLWSYWASEHHPSNHTPFEMNAPLPSTRLTLRNPRQIFFILVIFLSSFKRISTKPHVRTSLCHCRHSLQACIFIYAKFYQGSNLMSSAMQNKANLRDLIAATGLVIFNLIQIVNFSTRVTVKFHGWPRKTIGHFFYTTSSFVHHFKSIGEFKLDLQSRNAQFGAQLVICYPVWPWNLMDDLGKQ